MTQFSTSPSTPSVILTSLSLVGTHTSILPFTHYPILPFYHSPIISHPFTHSHSSIHPFSHSCATVCVQLMTAVSQTLPDSYKWYWASPSTATRKKASDLLIINNACLNSPLSFYLPLPSPPLSPSSLHPRHHGHAGGLSTRHHGSHSRGQRSIGQSSI